MMNTNFTRLAAAAAIAAFAFPVAALAQDDANHASPTTIDIAAEMFEANADLGRRMEAVTVAKADAAIAARLATLDDVAPDAPARDDAADTLLVAALR